MYLKLALLKSRKQILSSFVRQKVKAKFLKRLQLAGDEKQENLLLFICVYGGCEAGLIALLAVSTDQGTQPRQQCSVRCYTLDNYKGRKGKERSARDGLHV